MKKIFDSIKQIYFHEIEMRDKIFARLQFNFAIYASFLAVIAYMLRMLDYQSNCSVMTLFFVGMFTGVILLLKSIYFTYISLTGLEYRLIPPPNIILNYKKELELNVIEVKKYNEKYSLNEPLVDVEKSSSEFITEMFAKCSTFNLAVNETRRIGIKKSLWYLMLASLPIIFSSILFVSFDLDVSSPRKELLIKDENLANKIELFNNNLVTLQQKYLSYQKKIIGYNAMTKEVDNQNKEVKAPPPPPAPPIKPEWIISNESFEEPMPEKSKVLQEKK